MNLSNATNLRLAICAVAIPFGVVVCLHEVTTVSATTVSTPFGTSYQVNVDGSSQNIPGDAANEPSLCLDPNHPNCIAIGWRQFDTTNSDFRQAGFGYSTNGGVSWTFGGTLETNVYRSDPVLASDAEGRFYFLSSLFTQPRHCDLWRSTNSGVSWQQIGPAAGGDKAWMAIDTTSSSAHGNIYQAWNLESDNSDRDFTASYDGGLTWAVPLPLPLAPGAGTLDIGPDGELYLIGWDSRYDVQCWLCRSSTVTNRSAAIHFELIRPIDLAGFLPGNLNGPDPNPGGLLGQAWVAVDRSTNQSRGNVYALCSTSGSTNLCDVMFTRSTNGGESWSAPRRINTDPGTNAYHWFGTLAVAPNGRVDVCWYDTRNSKDPAVSELYYCYSLDGGLNWSPNYAISPPFNTRIGWATQQQQKIGDYIGMISLDEAACIAYSATFNGEQDIYFVRVEPPLLVTSSITNATIQLSWKATPGKTYCLQFKDSLNAPWSVATNQLCLVATNSVMSITDPILPTAPQRYYRVLKQP
jgi:hypothetical protein